MPVLACGRAGRCIAPDLIGMRDSQKLAASGPGSYSFAEHRRYLAGLLAALNVERNVTLVVHDCGSALGFDQANRHPSAVLGIAYMEAIVQPLTWDQWSPQTRTFFGKLRSLQGEQMILEDNLFIESLPPQRVLRMLTSAEMDAYRRRFAEPGENRRPMLTWPRQLPVGGAGRRLRDRRPAAGSCPGPHWLATVGLSRQTKGNGC